MNKVHKTVHVSEVRRQSNRSANGAGAFAALMLNHGNELWKAQFLCEPINDLRFRQALSDFARARIAKTAGAQGNIFLPGQFFHPAKIE